MLATLGRRPAPATGTWAAPPDVRPISDTRAQFVPPVSYTHLTLPTN